MNSIERVRASEKELIDYNKLILKIFRKEKHDKICWQPRIKDWYNTNSIGKVDYTKEDEEQALSDFFKISYLERHKFVPVEWIGKSIFDIHDELNSSLRYHVDYFETQESLFPYKGEPNKDIITKESDLGNRTILRQIETPMGKIQEKFKMSYTIEKPVKNVEDLKVMTYLIENQPIGEFDKKAFAKASDIFGKRGLIQLRTYRSPFQRCLIEFLGIEKMAIFFKRYPSQMENFLVTLEEMDKKVLKLFLDSDVQIINFPENIHCQIVSPKLFEKYHLPYYKKRVKMVHDKNKFCHIHMDGFFKDLLPYLADLPFDGIEALTPEPQGDVTLEEIRDNVGDKILLDVIPATLFMPQFPEKQLVDSVNKILEYFGPNLLLGVSDLLPGNADGRRLKTVCKTIHNYENN